MIKQTFVVMCDVCGAAAPAKINAYTNMRDGASYEAPADWFVSAHNKNVHLCPECSKGLKAAPRGPVRAVHMPEVVKGG